MSAEMSVEYLAAFSQVLLPVAHEFAPELVLVSAGFDAAEVFIRALPALRLRSEWRWPHPPPRPPPLPPLAALCRRLQESATLCRRGCTLVSHVH
jgi:hypothetical protein